MKEADYKKQRAGIEQKIQAIAREHETLRLDRIKFVTENFNMMLKRQEEMLRELFVKEFNVDMMNQQLKQLDAEFKKAEAEEKTKDAKPEK